MRLSETDPESPLKASVEGSPPWDEEPHEDEGHQELHEYCAAKAQQAPPSGELQKGSKKKAKNPFVVTMGIAKVAVAQLAKGP